MSKIFYDRIIILEKVEKEINSIAQTEEEKDELRQIVDEIIHHKVFGCILKKLPERNHQEFLQKFNEAPHDETLFDYLKEKIKEDIEELIKQEMGNLAYEILQDIKVKNPK
jgi:transcriptional regulator of NAD metabolism